MPRSLRTECGRAEGPDQASYYGFSTIWLEHAGAWITFTTSFLHQMNSRPLAGLIRRYGNFSTDPGGASWHIGAEAWSLLFLSFLSCGSAQSSCGSLCSQSSSDFLRSSTYPG